MRVLAAVVVLSAVLGVVMGVVWSVVAPTPALVAGQGGFYYASELPGQFVAMDGWFAVLGAAAGVVVAVVALARWTPDWLVVTAVAVSGLLASLLAWAVGHALGPSRPHYSASLAAGATAHGQLTLTAKGVLVAWPVLALAVLMFALAWQYARPAEDEPAAVSVGGDREVGQLDGGQ